MGLRGLLGGFLEAFELQFLGSLAWDRVQLVEP